MKYLLITFLFSIYSCSFFCTNCIILDSKNMTIYNCENYNLSRITISPTNRVPPIYFIQLKKDKTPRKIIDLSNVDKNYEITVMNTDSLVKIKNHEIMLLPNISYEITNHSCSDKSSFTIIYHSLR